MSRYDPIPIVRCHLGPGDDPSRTLRYVPLGEFQLWRYMMETRHRREVVVEDISLWVPDDAMLVAAEGADPELCDAVVRLRFEVPGRHRVAVPVERFFAALTYPVAQATLMAHYETACRAVTETAGYFVPGAARTQSDC